LKDDAKPARLASGIILAEQEVLAKENARATSRVLTGRLD
jgi:hypothetical protein